MNNYKSGVFAELIARIFFRCKGYKIIASNYITGKGSHAGEVDFIAEKRKTIVFVEVKKRSSLDNAAYAIKSDQKRRICKGAESFLKRHPSYQSYNQRFDVILVSFPLKLRHLENAWLNDF